MTDGSEVEHPTATTETAAVPVGRGHARWLRRGFAFACCIAASAAPMLSKAQPKDAQPKGRSVRLLWTRGPQTDACPPNATLMKGVATRLGYDPFAEDASRMVVGSVAHTRGRYVITLQLVDGTESFSPRQLESSVDDCTAVTQAAALSIAVDIEAALAAPSEHLDDAGSQDEGPGAIDAGPGDAAVDEGIDKETSTARPTKRTSPDAGAPRTPKSSVANATNATRPPGAALSIGPAVAVGLLPRIAAGINIAGAVRFGGPLSISVGMTYFPEVEADDPNFQFASTLVRGGACLELIRWRGNELGGCVHAVAGSTTLIIQTLQPLKPGSRFFVAPAVGLRFARSLGPMFLSVGADIHTPFPRYEFAVAGTNRTVFTTPLVAAVGYAEVGVGF